MERDDYISLLNRITVLSHSYRNLIKLGVLSENDPIIHVVRGSIVGVINYFMCRNEKMMPLKNDTDRSFLERSFQKQLTRIIRRAVKKSLIPNSEEQLTEIIQVFERMYPLIGELIRYWCTDPSITPRHPCNYSELDIEELDQVVVDLKRLEFCLKEEKYTDTAWLLERFKDYYFALEDVFEECALGWEKLETKLMCLED